MNASSLTLSRQIIKVISASKRIPQSRISPSTHLFRHLDFDVKDLVDVIFALERQYGIVIPDEVPIETVGDLIRFIAETSTSSRQAAA